MRKNTVVLFCFLAILTLFSSAFARPPLREVNYEKMSQAQLNMLWENGKDLRALLELKSRNNFPPEYRIGLMTGQETVKVKGEKTLLIAGKGMDFTVNPGDIVEFRLMNAKPATLVYKVIVKEFSNSSSDEVKLQEAAYFWENEGCPVDIINVQNTLKDKKGNIVTDIRKTWVSVATGKNVEEADKIRAQILEKYGISSWVQEEKTEDQEGRIDAFVNGKFMGSSMEEYAISSPSNIEVLRVEHGVGYSWHGFQDRKFRGKIIVATGTDGKLCAINQIKLDPYLMGVVPSEIGTTAPIEALKAQAIAARGEALAKYGFRHLADPFDLCAEQHCQVYSGIVKETAATNRSVMETEGMILRYNGRIVDAVYSANCGGVTENAENVWSTLPQPYLTSVRDVPSSVHVPDLTKEANLRAWVMDWPGAWCGNKAISSTNDRFRWERKHTAKEINQWVSAKYPDIGEVKEINPGRRGHSGRIWDLEIVGTKGRTTIIKELPIRQLFGGLRSAAFVVDRVTDSKGNITAWQFYGAGWGHGVGMCQVGAISMAMNKHTATEILTHYFQKSQVDKVY